MTTDVLSDVLRAVHLTGALYFDFELSSPWVAETPRSSGSCRDSWPWPDLPLNCEIFLYSAGFRSFTQFFQRPLSLCMIPLLELIRGLATVRPGVGTRG